MIVPALASHDVRPMCTRLLALHRSPHCKFHRPLPPTVSPASPSLMELPSFSWQPLSDLQLGPTRHIFPMIEVAINTAGRASRYHRTSATPTASTLCNLAFGEACSLQSSWRRRLMYIWLCTNGAVEHQRCAMNRRSRQS
jgi:hypothetical protein